VIERAKELAEELTNADITVKVQEIGGETAKSRKAKPKKLDPVELDQMSLFDTVSDADVLKELEEIDVSNLTPIDALNTIYRLQNKLKNRW
jgi:DNA mismatch repair protein MutS